MSVRTGVVGILVAGLLSAWGTGAELGNPAAGSDVQALVRALGGPDAVAEWRASQQLVTRGDAAVPALAHLARSEGALAPRLIAIELLGHIGTRAARDALVDLLTTETGNLPVRNQLCIQLGCLRERRAVPAIAAWLRTIGPRALDDIPGPKEAQPSTVYCRHIEALAMIGDESAIPLLEEFAKKVPRGVGFGGFLSNFVLGTVDHALAALRDSAAFWRAVRTHPGLEAKLAPLFEHLRSDPVGRFRFHESEVLRRTEQGRAILQRLARNRDTGVASAAQSLLENYPALSQ